MNLRSIGFGSWYQYLKFPFAFWLNAVSSFVLRLSGILVIVAGALIGRGLGWAVDIGTGPVITLSTCFTVPLNNSTTHNKILFGLHYIYMYILS